MKKLLALLLSFSVALLAACGKQPDNTAQNTTDKAGDGAKTIVIASTGSDADVWRFIATLPETKQANINLQVKNFTDYVAMNNAVANKEIDVNAFQSYAYLVAFNNANQNKIAPVSTTYLEPMGIYSAKYKKLDQFPQGAVIVIPNDGANESRALLLLQSAGLVKLKAGFDAVKGTPADVVENPKAIVIKPVQMATAARIMNDVDAIVLGNTLAMEAGLNVLKDAIIYEPINQDTKMNINVLATAADRQNDPTLQKLGEIYHSEAVKKYIQEHFGGTKVDVNKPVSYLTGQN